MLLACFCMLTGYVNRVKHQNTPIAFRNYYTMKSTKDNLAQPTTLRLDKSELAKLEKLAKALKMKKVDIIRIAVGEYISKVEKTGKIEMCVDQKTFR